MWSCVLVCNHLLHIEMLPLQHFSFLMSSFALRQLFIFSLTSFLPHSAPRVRTCDLDDIVPPVDDTPPGSALVGCLDPRVRTCDLDDIVLPVDDTPSGSALVGCLDPREPCASLECRSGSWAFLAAELPASEDAWCRQSALSGLPLGLS